MMITSRIAGVAVVADMMTESASPTDAVTPVALADEAIISPSVPPEVPAPDGADRSKAREQAQNEAADIQGQIDTLTGGTERYVTVVPRDIDHPDEGPTFSIAGSGKAYSEAELKALLSNDAALKAEIGRQAGGNGE